MSAAPGFDVMNGAARVTPATRDGAAIGVMTARLRTLALEMADEAEAAKTFGGANAFANATLAVVRAAEVLVAARDALAEGPPAR